MSFPSEQTVCQSASLNVSYRTPQQDFILPYMTLIWLSKDKTLWYNDSTDCLYSPFWDKAVQKRCSFSKLQPDKPLLKKRERKRLSRSSTTIIGEFYPLQPGLNIGQAVLWAAHLQCCAELFSKVFWARSITDNELSHRYFLGRAVLLKINLSLSSGINSLMLIDMNRKLCWSHTN